VAYLVVKGLDLTAFGFGRSNLFHSEQTDLNRCFEDMYVRGDYSRPSFALTTPTLLTDEARDCPPDCTIVELLTVANYQRFLDLKLHDEKAYRREKKRILGLMLDILERDYVPGLRDHLVFQMTGSPTTNERFCGAPRGNSYGSNMTPAQMGLGRLTYDSSLRNFWFCNASSGYAGFAGTIWTGRRLFEALSGERLVS
jgi:all-trans-retinol 13,14-reductase